MLIFFIIEYSDIEDKRKIIESIQILSVIRLIRTIYNNWSRPIVIKEIISIECKEKQKLHLKKNLYSLSFFLTPIYIIYIGVYYYMYQDVFYFIILILTWEFFVTLDGINVAKLQIIDKNNKLIIWLTVIQIIFFFSVLLYFYSNNLFYTYFCFIVLLLLRIYIVRRQINI